MRVFEVKQPNPFLSRKELEDICSRLNKAPNIKLEIMGDEIVDESGKTLLTVHRLGCADFFLHCIEDMNRLVEHVLNADEQNTLLEEKVSLQQEQLNLLSKKLLETK